jgi:hypothetical protein
MEERRVTDAQAQFGKDLTKVLEQLEDMLVAKNRKYGDAALNPTQTFSRSSAVELINVRIDDKLSRIRNRQNDEDEDPEFDLLGYLILKRIALMRETEAKVGSKDRPMTIGSVNDPMKHVCGA